MQRGAKRFLRRFRGSFSLNAGTLTGLSKWTSGLFSPLADVPDDTVGRFAAGRFRTAYRWLRPLLSDEDTDAEDGSSGVGSEPSTGRMEGTGLQLSRTELDNKAEVFSAGLIKEWVGNPSNIRLLRIGLDILPSVDFLEDGP